MSQDIIDRATEIVLKNSVQGGEFCGQICVLSLIDAEGFPTASVITPSRSEGLWQLALCTSLDESRAKRAANCSRASVCFSSEEYCVNLVGEIEVVTSADVKREMWYDGLAFHFTGADDPRYCVLKFTTKRYKLFIDDEEIEGAV